MSLHHRFPVASLAGIIALSLSIATTSRAQFVSRSFASRPALSASVGAMVPVGQLSDRYGWGPNFKGAVNVPIGRRLILVGEGSYSRLPVRNAFVPAGTVVEDTRLLGGSAHLVVPIGAPLVPVPGLGRGTTYLIGGAGLFQMHTPTVTESYRPAVTSGVGLSFDTPRHHEAFVELRVMRLSLKPEAGYTVPVTFGFRW